MLDSGIIDAVYIAVPNDLNPKMTVIAARHGVHVLCEKPIARTDTDACRSGRARRLESS